MSNLEGVQEVHIADLVQHRAFQVRRKLDIQRVRTYAAGFKVDGDIAREPILVGRIRSPDRPQRGRPPKYLEGVKVGALVLLAGYHRVQACTDIGKDTILARIVDTTAKQAQWLAAESNLSHGLPLKPREVREAFYAYLRAGQHRDVRGNVKSLRDMGRKFGKHHETIRDWLNVPEFRHIHRLFLDDAPSTPPPKEETLPEDDPTEATMTTIDEALRIARNLSPGLTQPQRARLKVLLEGTLKAIEADDEGTGNSDPGFPY